MQIFPLLPRIPALVCKAAGGGSPPASRPWLFQEGAFLSRINGLHTAKAFSPPSPPPQGAGSGASKATSAPEALTAARRRDLPSRFI